MHTAAGASNETYDLIYGLYQFACYAMPHASKSQASSLPDSLMQVTEMAKSDGM